MKTPAFFCGIDPGHKGAFVVLNAAGTSCRTYPMPVVDPDLDFNALKIIFGHLKALPNMQIGLEWPTAFPGSFANNPRDAEIFGQQKGALEAFAFTYGLEYIRVTPQAWKGKLGLDGKTVSGANARAAQLWDEQYPVFRQSIRGPRGGLLDGLLDAGLIAHFLRVKSGALANTQVRGSVEHLQAVLSMGPGKRRLCRGASKNSV